MSNCEHVAKNGPVLLIEVTPSEIERSKFPYIVSHVPDRINDSVNIKGDSQNID